MCTKNNAVKWKKNAIKERKKNAGNNYLQIYDSCGFAFFSSNRRLRNGSNIFFLFALHIIDFSFILSIVANHSFFLRLVIISCHFRVIQRCVSSIRNIEKAVWVFNCLGRPAVLGGFFMFSGSNKHFKFILKIFYHPH